MSVLLHQPFADETWQSVIAAHQRGWSVPARSRMAEYLLGSARAPVAYDYPNGLKRAIGQLPGELRLDPEGVLSGHTLLSLHRPFLSRERWKETKVSALADRHLQFILGVGPSRINRPRWLKLCPKCVVSDRRAWGRAYWHRAHQVPGAWTCPDHRVPLWETNVRAHRDAVFELVAADDAKMVRRIRMSTAQRRIMIGVARDLAALLNPDCPAPEPDQLQAAYFAELRARGLVTAHGRVKHTELCRHFMRFYGRRLLLRLGCEIDPARRDHWLARLVHRSRWHSAPLRHVLLIRFLGHDAPTFLARALAHHPFMAHEQVATRPPRIHRIEKKQILEQRRAWLAVCRTESGDRRDKFDALYSWLWRYDRDWLRLKRRKAGRPIGANCRRESLDRELAAEVREAARIALRDDPAARLSRRRIAEHTSRPFLVQRNSPAMPATAAAMRQAVEDIDSCAMRRLRSATRSLPRKHRRIRWRLMARAGLGPTIARHHRVRCMLDVLIACPSK